MKFAARAVFVISMVFAALAMGAYGIAAAAPGLKVGEAFRVLVVGGMEDSIGAGSGTPESTESATVDIGNTFAHG